MELNELYEELIYLCEVRGELDPDTNVMTEARIAELNTEIKAIESLGSRWS